MSHLSHSLICNEFNHAFELLIFMPLLKDLNFVKIGLKRSTVVLQNVSFSIAGSLPPDPFASGGWDVAPKPQPPVAGGLASRPPIDRCR